MEDAVSLALVDETSLSYLGQWNRLVSTTNWEKGRIIQEWREALTLSQADPSEYSDEAWSRRVGNVSGQHVGRLRRVYERFNELRESFAGLYWSHFQAALDWEDAEMWLEGAVQNDWSISEMRTRRWETLGGIPDDRPVASDDVPAEYDEDSAAAATGVFQADLAEVRPLERAEPNQRAEPRQDREPAERECAEDSYDAPDMPDPVRPFADLSELPADLAEALETFKLAIVRHKLADWQQVARSEVLACLDALRTLALAPA